MLRLIAAALAVLAAPCFAQAQPGQPDMRFDSTTCHTWEGGLGAQGSYTRCPQGVVIVQAPPRVETREVVREVVREVPGPVVRDCQQPAPPVVKPKPRVRKPVPTCKP